MADPLGLVALLIIVYVVIKAVEVKIGEILLKRSNKCKGK